MPAQDAIDRAARNRDLAAAMRQLVDRRTTNPLAGLPVVTTEEVLALTNLPARKPDWIDQAMARSVRFFESPLNTPAKRRLAGATLRRSYSTSRTADPARP